ncbi:MAG: hypothetical protein LBC22_05435 [Endomicrobium sp.]|jgi:hypothetical protein|nr:hypothetical protein [Endomicrobium sp.]
MNLKTKILDYFKEHWKGHIFIKSVCMVVSACLILNILNLPAFASTEEDLRKKAFSSENKQQDVLYQKDTSFNSVSVMNSLEANIKIDKKTENIFVGKELKGFLSKEKDEQGRRKVMVRKGEGFEEDPVLTAMVDNKLKGRKSSSGVETRQISQEQSPSVKEGESAGQQKDKTSQEQQSKEAEKEERGQSQSPKEESVPKQQEGKGVQEETIEQEETSRQQEKPKQESQPEQKGQTETAREGSSKRQEQSSDGQSAIDVEKSSDTSKRVQELAETLQKEEKDRAKVIDEIARETGLSIEGIEAELSKLDQTQREGVIAALANLFGQGKDIVYCVADVLGTVLEETSKGLLGFEAILAEAIAGIFVKNNQDLISGKSDQLMLSAQAIQRVLEKYGKDYSM